MKTNSYKSAHGFTLIEMLVIFVLIAILCGLLIPKYLQMRTQSNIQIAQQQVDTVQKAALSWLASYPSVAAAQTAYGGGAYPSATAWSGIINYLDPGFVITVSSDKTYFTTQQMVQIPGAPTTSQTTSYAVPLPTVADAGLATAVGVIYWPTSAQPTGQPVGVLFHP